MYLGSLVVTIVLSVLTVVSNLEEACLQSISIIPYLSHLFPLGEWVYFFLLVALTW